uniref:Uncharacterized protein n=1 Tax=Rhodosorus marinus TaxID=101924 RepID=A0A7S0BMI8_9RHOD|mmetsp:Transcript_22189/g.32113  ORF Transcript_22189/g.32113 Transcript_22189/m.32113 type:complete len:211 (+) Transcript_22189:140-772(+)
MLLLDWFLGILFRLGLFYKRAKVLFLGLDNAGKTSLLNRLKLGAVSLYAPTTRVNIEQFSIGGIVFTAFDVGGHEMWRHLWSDFYESVDAVVFIVDSADRGRFEEAKEELHALLEDPSLISVPFLILGNKQDVAGAAHLNHIIDTLEIRGALAERVDESDEELGMRKSAVKAMGCSVLKDIGVEEAMHWVCSQIAFGTMSVRPSFVRLDA